jgi:hypothetical protein
MAARLNVVRILWCGLMVANAMSFVLAVTHAQPHSTMPPHFPELAGAISLGIAMASIVLPARGFAMALRNMKVEIIDAPGEVLGGFRESAPVVRVIAEPERALSDALVRFQTPFILGMALAESIGLFGLMIGFLGGPPIAYAPFFGVSTALMLSKFPTLPRIERALERAKNAKLMA